MRIPYWQFLIGPTALYYLGAFFNLGVMALNHGQMPVQMPLGTDAGMDMDIRHSIMTAATHLKFFCDWLQLGDGIASPGDLLIWFGEATQTIGFAIWGTLCIKKMNEYNIQ